LKHDPSSRSPSFGVAIWGLSAVCGALAGLGDATISAAAGRTLVGFPQLTLFAVSLGVLACVLVTAPLVLAVVATGRPRADGARLGAVGGLVVLLPVIAFLGRWFYQRLPLSGFDVALAALAAGCVLAAWFTLVRMAGRLPEVHARGILRLGFRCVPLVALAAPVLVRVAPALFPTGATARASAGENLLLLTIDTLRADALGTLGDPRARTPHLDRLARASVTFRDCIAPAPWTLPTLGSIHTGTYPAEHGLSGPDGLDPGVPTLAEACESSDRRTGAFVSNPWLATRSLARGFDTYDVAEKLESIDPLLGTFVYGYLHKLVLRVRRQDDAYRISRLGVEWIARGRGPWFLWLHYFDPHLPNRPPRPLDRLFGPPPGRDALQLPAVDDEIRSGRHELSPATRADLRNLYDAEVTYTDGAIGRVLRHLGAAGIDGETAIVFSSDHGEEFWDHGGYEHGHQMFDELVRVPLIVRAAGMRSARIVDTLVRTIDMPPTALAAAGIDAGAFDSGDLLADTDDRRSAYGEATLYGEEQKFLRSDDWKIVARRGDEPSVSVFDLRSDPSERFDLVPGGGAPADSLQRELDAWIERVGSTDDDTRGALDQLDPATRDQLKAVGYLGG